MSCDEIKQLLLSCCIVVDNDFLDKYCLLIEQNRNTRKQKYKTQRHHIVPKFYYKEKGLTVDSRPYNLVNLNYRDHCLAHYYLALCSINDKYRLYNVLSIRHVLGHQNLSFSPDEKNFVQKLPFYQELYEESKKLIGEKHRGKIISQETREKEKIAHLGKKYKPMSIIGRQNISASHLGKNTGKRSIETRERISQGRIKKKFKNITKNGKMKSVPENELSLWLAEGWVLGTPFKNKKNGKVWIVKGEQMLLIREGELSEYLMQGWKRGRRPLSEEAKQKIREANKKRVGEVHLKWYNNGVEEVKAYECPEGFNPGRINK